MSAWLDSHRQLSQLKLALPFDTFTADKGNKRGDPGRCNRIHYWAKKEPEGTHQAATRVGARSTLLGVPPALWATWQASGAHLLLYDVF